jgi:hypothetical protein
MTNQEIIRKADLSVADLTSDGGLLNPEQANRFVRKLINEPTILRDVRTVEMSAPTRNINKIQFNKRILRAGTSATALSGVAADASTAFDPVADAATRAKPLTEQIQLNTSEVIGEVDIPYDVIEDNIERGDIGQHQEGGSPAAGGGFMDTLLALMAERAALDLEELAILGDTTLNAADTYLDLQDGYVKRIEDSGNTSDQAGAAISKTVFKNGMKVMPDQYLRNIQSMRHYVSFDQETEYRDSLADRATSVGDQSVQGRVAVTPFGVPVSSVALMPDDKGILTNPRNLVWGVQRRIHLEWDKDITSRVIKIVLTARIATQVEEAEAAVVYNNIGV